MGKYLELLDRAALQEQKRDKSDKSDKSPPLTAAPVLFGRLCRFGRRPKRAPETWTDTEEERAAVVEYDGGVPRTWAEGFARLNPNKPPGDIPPRRWLQFIDDCGRFLDGGCSEKAAALGWGPLDLFGCDRERPFARVDHLGLLWLLNGGSIVELHRDCSIIEMRGDARHTYRRHPIEVGRVVLAWELAG